jgi:uncharacterized membrane protein YcjF (UPF0283 family)
MLELTQADQQAIDKRDIRDITKYRMKKNKSFQKQINTFGFVLISSFLAMFIALSVNKWQNDSTSNWISAITLIVVIVAGTIMAIIDTRTTNRIKAEVKKQYGV